MAILALGTDLAKIVFAVHGVNETGAVQLRRPKVTHFARWLGLCPGIKMTGGKVMSGTTKRVANRAAQAVKRRKVETVV